jgi:hypothetical protein
MKTLKSLSAIGLLAIFLYGCAGKDGAPGATGPAGPAGVANISTATFTVTPGGWTTIIAGAAYEAYLTVPAITDFNNDAVEVSTNAAGLGTFWIGLPLYDYLSNGDEMVQKYGPEEVKIHYNYSSAPSVDTYFKVTVIPPAIMKQHPNINWHDGAQVRTFIDAASTQRN